MTTPKLAVPWRHRRTDVPNDHAIEAVETGAPWHVMKCRKCGAEVTTATPAPAPKAKPAEGKWK